LPARIPLAERENVSSQTPLKNSNSGCSGLEADQKVIAAHGCYAMTATTALTAQNTKGVFDIHQIPPDFVKKQIDACIEDIGVDVIKTGISPTIFDKLPKQIINLCEECLLRKKRSMLWQMQSKNTKSHFR
jgi:hydroxymethylpyrimidine/phosphomethylpyrimidine kinase